MKDLKLLALVPAYNEQNRIAQTIRALKLLPEVTGVVVADDCSADATVKKAKEAGAKVIKHEINLGKGPSLTKVIKTLNLRDFDGIILADGDLAESAQEFKRLISIFKEGSYDMVTAGFEKPTKKGGFGLVKGLARWAIKRYGGQELKTPLSGQRLLSVKALENLLPFASGFGMEVDMTIRALRSGLKVKEVPTKMKHAETGRDLAGFMHRGRQFWDILKAIKWF